MSRAAAGHRAPMLGKKTRAAAAIAATALTAMTPLALAPAHAAPTGRPQASHPTWDCGPKAHAVGYSDALDKVTADGATVGGLSSIAWDKHTHSFVSAVDDHDADPSRLWFYRFPANPTLTGKSIVLTKHDGTPYTGETADNEGLAVLPDGRFVVSSETEPSVRIFSRKGVQQASLKVPGRFRVAPAGQATDNATFEGLTISHDARQIVVSMEGTLSGDTGDGTYRRLLVYTKKHGHYRLAKQVGYRVEPGMRIPEIQEYAPHRLLVMEAAWTETAGNSVELYAVNLRHAKDVSRFADLANHPHAVMHKKLISDVTACPSLGATAKETQTNPLMDNFEGMATKPRSDGLDTIWLISDDNFSSTQTTRLLRLVAKLPGS